MTSRFVGANTIALLFAIIFSIGYIIAEMFMTINDPAAWVGFKAIFGWGGALALAASVYVSLRLLGPNQRSVLYALACVLLPLMLMFIFDVHHQAILKALSIIYLVFVVDTAYKHRNEIETEPNKADQAMRWGWKIIVPMFFTVFLFILVRNLGVDARGFPVILSLSVNFTDIVVPITASGLIYISLFFVSMVWISTTTYKKSFVIHGALISTLLYTTSFADTIYPAVWSIVGMVSVFLFLSIYEASHHKNVDGLTGLGNREALKFLTNTRRPSGVAVFDLDKFKAVNDTYGHDGGDTVLKTTGDILRSIPDSDGVAFRIGGEEFVILLYGENKLNLQTCEWVRAKIENTKHDVFEKGQLKKIVVTCSIGVRNLKEGESYDEGFKFADEAVYQAKETGRNQIVEAVDSEEDADSEEKEEAET